MFFNLQQLEMLVKYEFEGQFRMLINFWLICKSSNSSPTVENLHLKMLMNSIEVFRAQMSFFLLIPIK